MTLQDNACEQRAEPTLTRSEHGRPELAGQESVGIQACSDG